MTTTDETNSTDYFRNASPAERIFLTNYDPSKYPIITVTVDLAVFRVSPSSHFTYDVLLVKRGGFPYKDRWALPGGFLENGEKADQAAIREVQEETGIGVLAASFVKVLDQPDRDPRGRCLSLLHTAWEPYGREPTAGDDASEAGWVPVAEALKAPLAFDHNAALIAALKNRGLIA